MTSKDVEAIFHIRKARVWARSNKPAMAAHHILLAASIVGSSRVYELSAHKWSRVA